VSWEETKVILADLEKFCQNDDDIQRIRNIKKLKKQAMNLIAEGELDAIELIRKCSEEVNSVKKNAEMLAAQTPSSPEIEALENQLRSLEVDIRERHDEKKATLEQVMELEEKLAVMRATISGFSQEIAYDVPMMKYILSLYANIANIKWDFQKTKDKKVCGCFVNNKVVQNFSFDESELSPFQVANKLWDTINMY